MAVFAADDDRVHFEDVITLDVADWDESRAVQRELARHRVLKRMKQEGYRPAYRTHPHAERVADGRWHVQGWWVPQESP